MRYAQGMRTRWGVAAVMLGACSESASEAPVAVCAGRFELAADLSDAEQADVRSATERWNAFAASPVRLEPTGSGRCAIRRLGPEEHEALLTRHGDQPFGGIYDQDTGAIALDFSVSGRGMQALVLHEFGHSFGLTHDGTSGSIMADGHMSDDFVEVDRLECVRVGACR